MHMEGCAQTTESGNKPTPRFISDLPTASAPAPDPYAVLAPCPLCYRHKYVIAEPAEWSPRRAWVICCVDCSDADDGRRTDPVGNGDTLAECCADWNDTVDKWRRKST